MANLSLLAFDIEAGDIVLSDEHAHAWASALNDIRLVLGSRLDIIDEERADQVHHLTDWSKVENDDDYLAVVYNFRDLGNRTRLWLRCLIRWKPRSLRNVLIRDKISASHDALQINESSTACDMKHHCPNLDVAHPIGWFRTQRRLSRTGQYL